MFHFKNKEIKDLFQWSRDIVLEFDPIYAGEEVHFSNNKTNSLNKKINENGEVTIPNILLTESTPIEVYLFIIDEQEQYTKKKKILPVIARPKPEDYIYTEEENKIWDNKVDIFQGEGNSKKILSTDENGKVVTEISVDEILTNKDIPRPTVSDNGKFLGCENGAAKWLPVEVSGGGDISLGLTAASVGQTIKVKAVDENGKPTEWETADSAAEPSFPKFEKILSHTITEEEAAAAPAAFIWGTDKIPNLNDFNVFTLTIRSPDGSKITFTKWVRLRINNILMGSFTGGVTDNARASYTLSANRIYGFWVSDSIYNPSNASGQALATPYSALSYTSNLADSVEVTSIGFASYAGINELYEGVIVEIWGAK